MALDRLDPPTPPPNVPLRDLPPLVIGTWGPAEVRKGKDLQEFGSHFGRPQRDPTFALREVCGKPILHFLSSIWLGLYRDFNSGLDSESISMKDRRAILRVDLATAV